MVICVFCVHLGRRAPSSLYALRDCVYLAHSVLIQLGLTIWFVLCWLLLWFFACRAFLFVRGWWHKVSQILTIWVVLCRLPRWESVWQMITWESVWQMITIRVPVFCRWWHKVLQNVTIWFVLCRLLPENYFLKWGFFIAIHSQACSGNKLFDTHKQQLFAPCLSQAEPYDDDSVLFHIAWFPSPGLCTRR